MSTVRARDGVPIVARWSSGLRLRPLTPATAVRIRYGSPKRKKYGKHRIANRVGVDSEEGPPVPIPNTVVKLFSAENTWRAAAREDKATPTFFIYPKLRKRERLLTASQDCASGGRRSSPRRGRNTEQNERKRSNATMFLTGHRFEPYSNYMTTVP